MNAGRCSATGTDNDLSVTTETFARLDPGITRVFITENEINFLAFPRVADSLVIFGAGYGFEMLDAARWLQERTLHYWGDIDTHGFAILDQLRALSRTCAPCSWIAKPCWPIAPTGSTSRNRHGASCLA